MIAHVNVSNVVEMKICFSFSNKAHGGRRHYRRCRGSGRRHHRRCRGSGCHNGRVQANTRH